MFRVVCALAAVALCASHASAQSSEHPTARLHFDAPEGCSTREEIASDVAERLHRPVFVDVGPELEVHVRVSVTEQHRYRAEVTMLAAATGDPLGSRDIPTESSDCRALGEAIAVVLAVMLDLPREIIGLPPPIEPIEVPEPPPAPPPAPRLPTPEPPWRVSLGVSAGLNLGLLPHPALDVGAIVGAVRDDLLEVALELSYDWTDRAAAGGGVVDIQAVAARLMANMIFPGLPVELALRAGVVMGPMWGTGSGVASPNPTQVVFFFETRTGLRLALPLGGPVFLQVTADFGAFPLAPSFYATGVDGVRVPLYSPFFVTGSFAASVVMRLGG